MTYEIWDKASGNRIGPRLGSEADAFGLVYKVYRAEGRKLATELILVEYDDAHIVGSTEGEALFDRAMAGHQITAS